MAKGYESVEIGHHCAWKEIPQEKVVPFEGCN
jgi:hypothetical protein